jgi:catechol 2,3-dioxygenase-like lactoylglutathione lyase family enzyme
MLPPFAACYKEQETPREDDKAMALFSADSIAICCANVDATKRWWIEVFECKPTKLPADWDEPLPSNVALKLPGTAEPVILLSNRAEVQQAGLALRTDRPILFCGKLERAHEYLEGRGASPGPIQDGGGTQFFEVRDPEGNVIEICKEP